MQDKDFTDDLCFVKLGLGLTDDLCFVKDGDDDTMYANYSSWLSDTAECMCYMVYHALKLKELFMGWIWVSYDYE